MSSGIILGPPERRLLSEARRATLATIAADGAPRLVPICFAIHPTAAILYSALDDKPKRTGDPHRLARVLDLIADSRVSVLVDRWDESWTRLAWLRCLGRAALMEPEGEDLAEHDLAVRALRDRYVQYADQALEARPILRIAIERTTSWGDLEGDP
jgi:PPOX class probable F420-dependent enzyme